MAARMCPIAPQEFRFAPSTLRNCVPQGAAHEAAAGHALVRAIGYILQFTQKKRLTLKSYDLLVSLLYEYVGMITAAL